EDGRPPPTFAGRLKLQDFKFNAGEPSTGCRRSPRLSSTSSSASAAARFSTRTTSTTTTTTTTTTATIAATITTTSTSRSPSKRKAPSPSSPSDPDSPSTTPARKRSRPPSSYAPPSTYAHLPGVTDAIAPNLLILFIGLNPGIQTARTGHAYAHPTNLFWRLLHSSGITPRLCAPAEYRQLPGRYALGLTNIVARPSRTGAELSKREMDAGVAVLEDKVRLWRPDVACVVGKSIWESMWRVRRGRGIRPAEFSYGWQAEGENMGVGGPPGEAEGEREDGVEYVEGWKGARIFVATSTSGLAASLKPREKEEIWRELGVWAETRRAEKAAA
ncbi:DNA glycosylase, partial [Trichocladium antarcticum]